MSHLLSELSLVVDRIVLIAPARSQVLELAERLSVELTTDLAGESQNLKLLNYSPAKVTKNSFVTWTSFTLGMRAGAEARLTIVGFALENGLPSHHVFEMADGFIFYNPDSSPQSEEFLKLQLGVEALKKPAVMISQSCAEENKSFIRKALDLWSARSFKKLLSIDEEQVSILEPSLDWLLNF